MTLQHFTGEFLTFLEQRETRLLSWGFYNTLRWTPPEIEAAFPLEASPALQAAWKPFEHDGRTFSWLLNRMLQAALICAVPYTEDAYRTRFAEGVRLLANLRQMFSEKDWATGPRLVSDIKLHLAPRVYPRRDRPAADIWARLQPLCPKKHAALVEKCFHALAAGRDGKALHFAGFQARAFEHILGHYGATGFSGSVVCAGTGSGKTKAFYVPAFLGMVPELEPGRSFTKIIAIYPRNVLLADQLREAMAEAEKLRPLLLAAGRRPIRFGALLGPTPYAKAFDAAKPFHKWPKRGGGYVIPYLKAPSDGKSDLVWRDADRRAGRSCLYRDDAGAPEVPDGTLALTREEIQENPPDVLFLSVEMLNREMSNPDWQAAFGMRQGPERSPRLLLLDEVHAHQGLAGAQVAWVLRRWRYWSRIAGLHVTGLSATLRDAPRHLAHVAGLAPNAVQEFRPAPGLDKSGEMEAEGVEYNLALKGDPVSGSSLLATSIQTGMLLARLLTPRTQPPSSATALLRPEEFFRRKVFGFTDNLDAVNRWFSDMLDAERNRRLAKLRAVPPAGTGTPAVLRRRMDEGQIWSLPAGLGHDLSAPLVVTRCSSQDPGADINSDLIIATSSLEVGFDDPEVGAMLHHKRPGSMSSFIQRKGRAGRTRAARPWTVVVLSDYGADRWAFQSAERLFQPEVDALVLPMANPYVLRVQSCLFLIDWLGRRIGGGEDAFRYLQGPSTYRPAQKARARARELLRGILEGGTTWKEFREEFWRFFRRFSGLEQEPARQLLDDLLWHEPRPLLTQVIPTLLRKLEVGWSFAYPPPGTTVEDFAARRPLPQFVPKTTFFELDIGEATLRLENYGKMVREPETMAVARLFFETCPGRVSKRFATTPDEPGYWHPWSAKLNAGENRASVGDLFPQHTFLEPASGVPVFQPDAASAVHREKTFLDSSNSSWVWQTLGRAHGGGEPLPVRGDKPWKEAFGEAGAFLHSNAEWLEVMRHTQECSFEIRRHRQDSIAGSLKLERAGTDDQPAPEAVGFRLRVDGFRFVLNAAHLAAPPALSAEMLARFRVEYFTHRLATAPALRGVVNVFQADWLAQTALAMLTATALHNRLDLAGAQAALQGKRRAAAARVLEVIFQVRGVNVDGKEEIARLRQTLLDLWADPLVCGEIVLLEPLLWQAAGAEFNAWVRQRYAATLVQALRAAMISLAPQVSEDDLAVDVIPAPQGSDQGGFELLVTELSPGGLGQAETIAREIRAQPRRFLDALEFALTQCPREQGVAHVLGVASRAAVQSRRGGPLADAFTLVRQAQGFTETEKAKNALLGALADSGFPTTRELIVSVMTQLLRPASSSLSDRLVDRVNHAWRQQSRRLGLAVPPRTFAYTCVQHGRIGPRMRRFFESLGGEPPTLPQVYAQIQQLLLETCHDSCPECLHHPNSFYDFGRPSRVLARAWLDLEIGEVSLDDSPVDWAGGACAVLRARGRVRVKAGKNFRAALAAGLPALVAQEIELPDIRSAVTVARVERTTDHLAVVLHIPDFVHG